MITTTVHRHRCRRQHRAWLALARCIFPDAAWIAGQGPYAAVAWCGVTSVTLHADADAATHGLGLIDLLGCGCQCHGDHDLMRLDLDEGTAKVMPR